MRRFVILVVLMIIACLMTAVLARPQSAGQGKWSEKARLELHGSNPGCRSGDKDQGLPFFQSACGQRLLQCRRQVMHIAVAFGLNHVFRCFDHADEF